MPKKKETPSAKTDPPHKSSKTATPTNTKKPEDIKALDHSEPLKIAEVRESKKTSAVVAKVVEEKASVKESMKVEIEETEEIVPGEESKDIEVEEEEAAVVEGSYQEDFNDSLGGGGIEQSSKLNIKKEQEGHDQKNPDTKKEEVSKNDHE
jgi:hypothetical protein